MDLKVFAIGSDPLGLALVWYDSYALVGIMFVAVVGFWATSFSSLIGVWNGVSLMFTDFSERRVTVLAPKQALVLGVLE